jgi:hypothetical protein
MMLERHARMRLAIELIARRARISIVHQETEIPRDALRALYREYHGVSAPSGQLPALGGAAITTRRMQLQASLFAATYFRCGGNRDSRGTPTPRARSIYAAIAAHDLCRELAGVENSMDMTRSWTIARDLHIGTARLLGCRACEVLYLVADQSRFDRTCPVCALYRAYSDAPPATQPQDDNAFARSLLLPPEPAFRQWCRELTQAAANTGRHPIGSLGTQPKMPPR